MRVGTAVDRPDNEVVMVEETARNPTVETGGGAVLTSGYAVVTGGDTEADGREPNVPDTRLIGLQILLGISLSE